jgi:cell division protein FtsB
VAGRPSARARAAKRRHPSAGGRWSGTAWLTIAILLFVGLLFVFVFPTQTFLAQRRDVNEVSDRLDVLKHQNHQLEKQAAALETDEEVERLARERFGLVRPGEEAVVVVPPDEQLAPVPPPATSPSAPATP